MEFRDTGCAPNSALNLHLFVSGCHLFSGGSTEFFLILHFLRNIELFWFFLKAVS